jgi:adenine-specific DNA-methyltransferase
MFEKLISSGANSGIHEAVARNIAQLRALFPDVVTEGPDRALVDFDALRALLGMPVADTAAEKFGLGWHGKRTARQISLAPSSGTLRPSRASSAHWDDTKHLMIEGDNLEVLKLLQKSYFGKVKLIYIDPPYNTGKDFVYPDDFRDNVRNYLERTGQGEGLARLSTNSETSGRFHTTWLNMMYPRLRLARSLLREDGVLFVSIDDTECANLKLLLDDVFGAENFVSSIAWKKRSSPDARDTIGSVHDWILCYVKSASEMKNAISKMPLSEERKSTYKNPDGDPRGPWASVDMTGMTGRATQEQYFEVHLPSGRKIQPPPGRAWGLSERTYLELRADNRIWFGADGNNVPRIKRFLSESDGQVVPSLWDMEEVGSNDEATSEVTKLMGQPGVFDTPKPLRLLRRMLQIGTRPTDASIVLDFFAGSGTTGHAVLSQNHADGGNRRFILVQLPEPLDPESKQQQHAAEFCRLIGRPQNIAELTKERLCRAAKEIQEAHLVHTGDLGFRAFKLDSSNLRAWEPTRDDLEATLLAHSEHVRAERTEQDIIYELILKLGLDLCVPIETKTIAGKLVHSIGGGALLACLATEIARDEVEPLAQGFVAWHKTLTPAGDTTCVFRDSAFVDDVAKTNLSAILSQHGISNVRSL